VARRALAHLALRERACHIDHIVPLWRGVAAGGTNADENLRTLCRRCHVLRIDPGHRGMIAEALKRGVIGPDYRDHLWDDDPAAGHGPAAST
jgi:5-methylcytosine-specific restriction protein A